MIQLQCPGCGYLQTVSERRYFSGPEEAALCPHCNAPMPDGPAPGADSIPEEAAHKIMAFSRRILAGGEFSRDVVLALESMVRHYGESDEAVQALGIGYARLGDPQKAGPFLRIALVSNPDDEGLVQCLLTVQLAQKDFAHAVLTGEHLLSIPGRQPQDDDVAKLVLAHLGNGQPEKARTVMEAYPSIDSANPLVKHALKELKRASGGGLKKILNGLQPIKRLFGNGGLKSLQNRARGLVRVPAKGANRKKGPAKPPAATREAAVSPAGAVQGAPDEPLLEYWIYAPSSSVPRWEEVNRLLDETIPDREQKAAVREQLVRFVQKKHITKDVLLKQNAPDFFDYPEELIPRNSRDFTQADRETLSNAGMIIRVRLAFSYYDTLDYLVTVVHAVEAVRALTNGIVQDAVSHTLWGTERWKTDVVGKPLHNLVETHVHFEILEEDAMAWIHSHGMQKFELPEIEIEGVPTAQAGCCRRLMVGVAAALLERRNTHRGLTPPLELGGSPFLIDLDPRPQDEEGHFPIGSLRIFPYVADYEARNPNTLRHVLKVLESRAPGFADHIQRRAEQSGEAAPTAVEPPKPEKVKTQLLAAHQKAKQELDGFRRSFHQKGAIDGDVHAVKVGFPTEEGRYEWMWVSLEAWYGQSIVGHVENDPILRKDLQKGSQVNVDEGEVFDWVIAREGKVVSGAFTERLTGGDC